MQARKNISECPQPNFLIARCARLLQSARELLDPSLFCKVVGLRTIDPARRPDEGSTYLYGKAGQQSWAVLRKS